MSPKAVEHDSVVYKGHSSLLKREGEGESDTKERKKIRKCDFLQHSTSLNIKSSQPYTDVYCHYWFEIANSSAKWTASSEYFRSTVDFHNYYSCTNSFYVIQYINISFICPPCFWLVLLKEWEINLFSSLVIILTRKWHTTYVTVCRYK